LGKKKEKKRTVPHYSDEKKGGKKTNPRKNFHLKGEKKKKDHGSR